MKIAVYGGSFNPPHLGHQNVIDAVQKTLKPDKLLIIPAFIPPHKELESGGPTPMQRMEMCRLAFADGANSNVEISDMEFRREGKSYTVDTVSALQKEYPGAKIFLVIGSDSFFDFEKWYRFEDIMKACTLCVVPREKGLRDALSETKKRYAASYCAKTRILSAKPFVISSTELRADPYKDGALCASVREYVKNKKLYK